MAVTDQNPIGGAVGNGVTTVFPFGYYIGNEADLVVQRDGVNATLNVDYVVAGAGNPSGGQIAFVTAPANGVKVAHFRNTTLTRATDYQDGGDLPARTVNLDFDRLWLALQEIFSGGKGAPTALRVPVGEVVDALPKASERANMSLVFDSTGRPIAAVPVSGSAADVLIQLASTSDVSKGDALLGVKQPLSGAVARTQHQKNQEFVSVLDFGAVGNGVANDLAALNLASAACAAAGKTLYFPDGVYGINDTFYFQDGVNAVFAPNAWIKLLNSTVSGGAVSFSYPSQSKPTEVHNLGVDCNNIAGENGVGIGRVTNSRLVNPRIKNVLHSPTIFGGKAIQLEGTEALDVQVIAPRIENATVGIDVGAVAGVQSVHITFTDVAMLDVDIPVYVNDTNTTTPSDNFDQIEVLIDGLHCRNCGKLTYSGATSTGGGIIVSDRGFKTTVRNVQVVNDRGGFTSTAYGTIGALVRGQGLGITVENVLIDSDMVAIFDHTPASFQSPFAGDIQSYVLADKIRHYGNIDFIVKCLPGGNKMGRSLMQGIEIGATVATPAGFSDANAAAYSTAYLEVINRDNNWFSTGVQSLAALNALGNNFNGNTQGARTAQMQGSWTPIDASGAGLVLSGAEGWWIRDGNIVTVWGVFTYPATANASNARIGGLPFTIKNNLYARAGGVLTASSIAGVQKIYPEQNGTAFPLLSSTSASVTNATCSGGLFAVCITYPVA